jgi:hypothetical protein
MTLVTGDNPSSTSNSATAVLVVIVTPACIRDLLLVGRYLIL